jgi:tetrapyrrole methylase family protein / MazG family protein
MGAEDLQGVRPLVYNALSAPRPLMANSAGARFDALLSLMARLRSEGGCPWDREQTRTSLKPYLIEEAYEVLQAIDEDDIDHLAEELGDLLFQVVFHSQMAAEAGEFTMSDVLDRLVEKMTRRHPHVFGDQRVADAQDALRQWEQIKRDEGRRTGVPRSALDGVPASLPALLRAQRLQVKAGRVGFDWPSWREAWDKVREEVAEVGAALDVADANRIRQELGDVLFSVVNVARLLNVDAEDCLRQAADKFTRRFNEVETDMKARGRTVSDASAEELDQAWETVKRREPRNSSGSGQ